MIYLSAQPDELYFAWQTEVQLENFRDLGVNMNDVYVLVGITNWLISTTKDYWAELGNEYNCHIEYIQDTRETKYYLSSIRPHIIAKFFELNTFLLSEYVFYTDSDVIFRELPLFEGMMDGKWHVSSAHYATYNYVANKRSPSLVQDMVGSVGITIEQAANEDSNSGGIHYFFPAVGADFWRTIERTTELMYRKVSHENIDTYKAEVYNAQTIPDFLLRGKYPPPFEEWKKLRFVPDAYDFQIWCADLFCIYWELVKRGIKVYANPALRFALIDTTNTEFEKVSIYHNSGIAPVEGDGWFNKLSYKNRTPFEEDLSNFGYITFSNGLREAAAQRAYIDIIQRLRDKKTVPTIPWELQDMIDKDSIKLQANAIELGHFNPKPTHFVSCVMTTYGRFTMVERSVEMFIKQDYRDKELIIYNTAPVPLILEEHLGNYNIKVVNNNIDYQTGKPYTNVGAIRRDASKLATGTHYICWDDDDMYLPWHISQGMDYIKKNPFMAAYMPKYSFFTPNDFNTIEYAQNSMEASCIVDIVYLRRYGFNNTNGDEHLTWRQGLRDLGLLDENNDVKPFESYIYVWGGTVSTRKQSAHMDDPNNFENHKLANIDFGIRPITRNGETQANVSERYFKIIGFVNNPAFTKRLAPYL